MESVNQLNIFIHVGLQKTGTTALQELVFKKMDVNYIRYLDRELYTTTMDPQKPFLFSNEDLSGVPYDFQSKFSDRYQIAENLSGLFPDASILIGIREKDSWLKSIYYESVRQGLSLSFDAFQKRISKDTLQFSNYISILEDLFYKVHVFTFEELQRDFDGVVKGICNFVKVPIPQYENKKMNLSLCEWQIPGFRLANKLFPKKLFRYYYNLIREDGLQ